MLFTSFFFLKLQRISLFQALPLNGQEELKTPEDIKAAPLEEPYIHIVAYTHTSHHIQSLFTYLFA